MCHGAHCLDGIVARGGLATEHEGVGAIVYGVGYVGHFGTCGSWIVNHGVQHLRGYDDRLLGSDTLAYDAALYAGNALDGHLDAKVKDQALVSSLTGHSPQSRAFQRYRTIDDTMKRELIGMLEE